MQKNGKLVKCKHCKQEFYLSQSRIGVRKYCSRECGYADNWGFIPKERKCIICGKKFIIKSQLRINDKTCSKECWYENSKNIAKKNYSYEKKTSKKDWLSYKNGKCVGRGLHSRKCAEYRKKIEEKRGYLLCEICGVNINGTPRFETHHIIPASKAPKHKELHNERNLICLCTQCHRKLHEGKLEKVKKNLIDERGLLKLFNIKY